VLLLNFVVQYVEKTKCRKNVKVSNLSEPSKQSPAGVSCSPYLGVSQHVSLGQGRLHRVGKLLMSTNIFKVIYIPSEFLHFAFNMHMYIFDSDKRK
jgi:hypothetical protein